jgi:CBS domain-containing protein
MRCGSGETGTATRNDMALARSHQPNAQQDIAERLRGLRAADIMSRRIVTVRPDCTLCDAAHLMIGSRISGLPVVNGDERLIGVVTEADFLRALGIPSHHPAQSVWHTLEAIFAHDVALKEECNPVSEIMVTDVVCAMPEWTVLEVIEVMKRNRVKRVIVCDALKHVCGMITRSDLVRVFIGWMSGREYANG